MNYNMLFLSVSSVMFLYILIELDNDIKDKIKLNDITKNETLIYKLNVISIFTILILLYYII